MKHLLLHLSQGKPIMNGPDSMEHSQSIFLISDVQVVHQSAALVLFTPQSPANFSITLELED